MPRFIRPRVPETPPTVSVVIPHYNYGKFLPTAVASALDQPGVRVEVIIVDDASTDPDSIATARSVAESDPRITLVEHATNMRHIATYNDGLARATGKYVVLLSADDILAAGSLRRATALMEADPAIGLVYGYAEIVGVDFVPPTNDDQTFTWKVWTGRAWIRRMCRRGRNVIRNPEAVMRRDLLEHLGWYDQDLPHSADMYLWLRAAAHSRVGRVNGVTQAYYRHHDVNMHKVDYGGLLDDYREVLLTYDRLLDTDGSRLTRTRALRRLAHRAVAHEAYMKTVTLRGEQRRNAGALLAFAKEADPSARLKPSLYASGESSITGRILRYGAHVTWMIRGRRELWWGT